MNSKLGTMADKPPNPVKGWPSVYRIEILGLLDSNWSDRLAGMSITTIGSKDVVSRTILEGQVLDQSALSGVLNTLCDLRYPLISVQYLYDQFDKK